MSFGRKFTSILQILISHMNSRIWDQDDISYEEPNVLQFYMKGFRKQNLLYYCKQICKNVEYGTKIHWCEKK